LLDKNKISFHAHLFYLEPSIYLLDKIKNKFDGNIYLSMNSNGKNNAKILEHAQSIFTNVKHVIVENVGNDQYGFFHSFPLNTDETDWVFYCHDKTIKRIDWLDEIIDPVIECEKLDNLLDNDNIGLVTVGNTKHHMQMHTEDCLTKLSKSKNYSHRLKIVQARHTLTWYRELQYILLTDTGLINTDNLNPDFTAGNMFLARKQVVKLTHDCIHESFFENYYREDGNVEHALERFYFYVTTCLKYNNFFIGLKEEEEEEND
tara:strand:+ start:7875 stop:8657 length:783 start_codon:yes stop_codon:yes gene_type:complete